MFRVGRPTFLLPRVSERSKEYKTPVFINQAAFANSAFGFEFVANLFQYFREFGEAWLAIRRRTSLFWGQPEPAAHLLQVMAAQFEI